MSYEVIVQKWKVIWGEWGTKPDGYSLHFNEADREAFIQAYWDELYPDEEMPDEIPDECSQPDGTPYAVEVSVETFNALKFSQYGLHYPGHPPGSSGIDG